LLDKSKDLSDFLLVIPGKRPVVFIKEILKEKNYNGILPEFFTIESNLYSTLSRRRFGEFPEMVPYIAKRLG